MVNRAAETSVGGDEAVEAVEAVEAIACGTAGCRSLFLVPLPRHALFAAPIIDSQTSSAL
jgi:hypothetical protein